MGPTPGLRVVTANVNGIRAAHRRGGLTWLADSGADAICLQEVRATRAQVDEVLADSPLASWHVAHAEAPDKGRAGVAVLTQQAPHAVRHTFRQQAINAQGRWVEVDLDSTIGPVTLASVYVHSGEAGTAKQEAKYAFLEGMDARMRALARRAKADGMPALVCGDFNIAHREVDIKNWKGNLKSAGFLPEERAYLDRWFARSWRDLGRDFGGEGPGPYTWWSWRGQAFDNDAGWRIDYHAATPDLADRAQGVVVGRAPSYDQRWSDHAPVMADFA
ncbi:MAG TPA: exodeoxyribonuclease III [Acidimicrobiia bacterium]